MFSSAGAAGSHEEESTTEYYDYSENETEAATPTPDYDYNATFDYYYGERPNLNPCSLTAASVLTAVVSVVFVVLTAVFVSCSDRPLRHRRQEQGEKHVV